MDENNEVWFARIKTRMINVIVVPVIIRPRILNNRPGPLAAGSFGSK